jgi:hypothetical protein
VIEESVIEFAVPVPAVPTPVFAPAPVSPPPPAPIVIFVVQLARFPPDFAEPLAPPNPGRPST